MMIFLKMFTVLFVVVLVSCCTNGGSSKVNVSLEQSPEKIKATLLSHTPIGTNPTSVLRFIHSKLHHEHKHSSPYYDKTLGATIPQLRGPEKVVGTRNITLLLGSYGRHAETMFLVSTKVYVQWAFDEKDQLIDIVVLKEGDGP